MLIDVSFTPTVLVDLVWRQDGDRLQPRHGPSLRASRRLQPRRVSGHHRACLCMRTCIDRELDGAALNPSFPPV